MFGGPLPLNTLTPATPHRRIHTSRRSPLQRSRFTHSPAATGRDVGTTGGFFLDKTERSNPILLQVDRTGKATIAFLDEAGRVIRAITP